VTTVDDDYWGNVAKDAEKSRNQERKKSAAYNARWRAHAKKTKKGRRKKR
jgi:hypothetical protein